MPNTADKMSPDSTPRASLGNDEADHAGACFSSPKTVLSSERLGRIVDSHPTVDLRPVGFPKNWREVLRIPDPAEYDLVRPRGRNGGRPHKDAAVVEQALYLYDMREAPVVKIAKQCGISLGTLYKYIHQREAAGKERFDYAVVEIPGK